MTPYLGSCHVWSSVARRSIWGLRKCAHHLLPATGWPVKFSHHWHTAHSIIPKWSIDTANAIRKQQMRLAGRQVNRTIAISCGSIVWDCYDISGMRQPIRILDINHVCKGYSYILKRVWDHPLRWRLWHDTESMLFSSKTWFTTTALLEFNVK